MGARDVGISVWSARAGDLDGGGGPKSPLIGQVRLVPARPTVGKTIYLGDHSLTCHLPPRTPRAGRAAARHSHNSGPRRGPRANKPITKDWWSVREGGVAGGCGVPESGIDRGVERKHRCAATLSCLQKTLFSNTRDLTLPRGRL